MSNYDDKDLAIVSILLIAVASLFIFTKDFSVPMACVTAIAALATGRRNGDGQV
jgi:hypothetical protein